MLILLSLIGCGVMTRTLDADNIITNYEWFYDASNNIMSRQKQISDTTAMMAVAKGDMLDRLTIELMGQKQSCRDLVAEYNSNASKSNRSIFMANNLPNSFDLEVCE